MQSKYGINVPCANCTNRAVGCHGGCGDYKDYRAKLDAINAEIKIRNDNATTIETYRNITKQKILSRR